MTLTKPSGTSAASASGRLGAAAASRAKRPKPAAEPAISFSVTRPRAPVVSAPATEPTAIATASAV